MNLVVMPSFTGLERWDKGKWGIGNKPRKVGVYTRDP